MNHFKINSNDYLSKDIDGYYHEDYLGFEKPGNPDFLNHLKNTFDVEKDYKIQSAAKTLKQILKSDLQALYNQHSANELVLCVVPRSKSERYYSDAQRMFKAVVSDVANSHSAFVDGTDYILRHTDTKTTHLANSRYAEKNDGKMPYPGITQDTCTLSRKIWGKHIVLIDDIYTKTVNVDEDAIEALLSAGAKSVTFYAVAMTKRRF